MNHDHKKDLVCEFYTQVANFECHDTEGFLMGNTMKGEPIEGKDMVTASSPPLTRASCSKSQPDKEGGVLSKEDQKAFKASQTECGVRSNLPSP